MAMFVYLINGKSCNLFLNKHNAPINFKPKRGGWDRAYAVGHLIF